MNKIKIVTANGDIITRKSKKSSVREMLERHNGETFFASDMTFNGIRVVQTADNLSYWFALCNALTKALPFDGVDQNQKVHVGIRFVGHGKTVMGIAPRDTTIGEILQEYNEVAWPVKVIQVFQGANLPLLEFRVKSFENGLKKLKSALRAFMLSSVKCTTLSVTYQSGETREYSIGSADSDGGLKDEILGCATRIAVNGWWCDKPTMAVAKAMIKAVRQPEHGREFTVWLEVPGAKTGVYRTIMAKKRLLEYLGEEPLVFSLTDRATGAVFHAETRDLGRLDTTIKEMWAALSNLR